MDNLERYRLLSCFIFGFFWRWSFLFPIIALLVLCYKNASDFDVERLSLIPQMAQTRKTTRSKAIISPPVVNDSDDEQ